MKGPCTEVIPISILLLAFSWLVHLFLSWLYSFNQNDDVYFRNSNLMALAKDFDDVIL